MKDMAQTNPLAVSPGDEAQAAVTDLTGRITPAAVATPCRLKVLVLDEEPPFPLDTGKRIRTWNLLRRLAGRHEISLLCHGWSHGEAGEAVRAAGICLHTVAPLEPQQGAKLYGRLFLNLFSRYPFSVTKHYTRRFREKLAWLLREQRFDLVHCEWTAYARYLDAVRGIPTLIASHNVESQIWYRRAQHSGTLVEKTFFGMQAHKMESFERYALRRVGAVTTVSEPDRGTVRGWGVDSASLVENGVDYEWWTPRPEPQGPAQMIFLGSLDWHPNADAAGYLLAEIVPLLRKEFPDLRLRVAGRRPPEWLRALVARTPGTELQSEFPDARDELARALVVVVPLRIGGGSRIKILEALAMGKPIVSTSVGAEGLDVRNGEHLLLADAPEAFAAGVADLLRSPQLRRRLGESGRRLVVERYGWDRAAAALEAVWQRLAGAEVTR